MPGLAMRKFSERESAFGTIQDPWPTLQEALDLGLIRALDWEFCLALKRERGQLTESAASIFAFLLAHARQGFLCVQNDPQAILDFLLQGEDLEGDLRAKLEALLREGVREMPKGIVLSESLLYLERHWNLECRVAKEIKRLLQAPPKLKVSVEVSGPEGLLPEQKRALSLAGESSLCLITGGPGTGKTFTAGQVLKCFIDEFPFMKLALGAPTGKAAANLEASLRRAAGPGVNIPQAKTLHALLRSGGGDLLAGADLVLLDESSMIEAELLAELLEKVSTGARLILLGDPYQLGPVGCGALFGELTQILPAVTKLKTCLRSELQEICDLAEAVRVGDFEGTMALLEGPTDCLSLREEPKDLPVILSKYFRNSQKAKSPREALEAFEQVKVLGPSRKGYQGITVLNESLAELLKKGPFVPILITKNDYSKGLFNGDMGVARRGVDGRLREAYFPARDPSQSFYDPEDKLLRIPVELLGSYDLAYCLSVHKSQGSEFQKVLVSLPEGTEAFGREILYTAVTRAKNSLEIIGSPETLQKILANSFLHSSSLRQKLGDSA